MCGVLDHDQSIQLDQEDVFVGARCRQIRLGEESMSTKKAAADFGLNIGKEDKGVVQAGARKRLRIAALIYSMTNAVIFGAGIIAVLNVPALSVNAHIWIPLVVIASLILAAPIAWLIAPRLQARYDRWYT